MQHYYASGASIYVETTDAAGNKTQRWFASTQAEPGVPPTARELDDARSLADMLDSYEPLVAACRAAQQSLRATSKADKDYSHELTLLRVALATC